eukprot:TRINITY_DN4279_c0_g1_i1.p1 TRINITY_DN4279_c0_g1~~TRINITY_DN4279_c0_g1_i1.p1  ORF type:complete len:436 (-),score=108.01 TRINITY_DN4279_c0_g1_i1:117-1397(-)
MKYNTPQRKSNLRFPKKLLLKPNHNLKKKLRERKQKTISPQLLSLSTQSAQPWLCRVCECPSFGKFHTCQKTQKQLPQDFEVLRTLGKGCFGTVYLVRRKQTKDLFALKAVKKMLPKKNVVMAEKTALSVIESPFVAKLYSTFQGQRYAYFLLENVKGSSLGEHLQKNPSGLDEQLCKAMFSQLVLAVKEIHEKDFSHRDLKPDNILWDSDNNLLKVIDFGYACSPQTPSAFAMSSESNQGLRYSAVGTPLYAPPETVLAAVAGYDGKKMDMWSLGVILFELLTGAVPFDAGNLTEFKEVLRTYVRNQEPWVFDWPETKLISEEAKSLVSLLLQPNPQARPSVDALQAHPFFRDLSFEQTLETALKASEAPTDDRNFVEDTQTRTDVATLLIDTTIPVGLQAICPTFFPGFDFLSVNNFQRLNKTQ